MLPVKDGFEGIDLDDLIRQVASARAAGLRPRALYVVPDFANPSGATMGETVRSSLLELADQLDLLIVEDSPYRLIGGAGRLPSLKAQDANCRVVHLGSFAKTVFPGVRVGYCLADQRTGPGTVLADQLAKIKSMVTVNTSPVTQAIVAGCLLEHGYSLERANSRETEAYRRNLAYLVAGLAERFGPDARDEYGVSWNVPAGASSSCSPRISLSATPSSSTRRPGTRCCGRPCTTSSTGVNSPPESGCPAARSP